MKLDEFKNQLEEDLPINATDLEYVASNNPVLYGKWLRYQADIKMTMLKLNNKLKKANKARLDYYTGRDEDEICPFSYEKSEMKTVMLADDEILKATTELEYMSVVNDLIRGALEAIKNRGFSIKHMLDQRSLESGK